MKRTLNTNFIFMAIAFAITLAAGPSAHATLMLGNLPSVSNGTNDLFPSIWNAADITSPFVQVLDTVTVRIRNVPVGSGPGGEGRCGGTVGAIP